MLRQIWTLPVEFPEPDVEVVPASIDSYLSKVDIHARITCMVMSGGQKTVLEVHQPSTEAVEAVVEAELVEQSKKASKNAKKKAKLLARKADEQSEDEDDEEAAAKRKQEAPAFKIVKDQRIPKSIVAPEAPKGVEEDDHDTLDTLLQKNKKTVKREQRKRMFSLKKKAARDANQPF